ncbi:MAG: hypothetical protein AAGN66_06950 [Acidobacteriota bacterium]
MKWAELEEFAHFRPRAGLARARRLFATIPVEHPAQPWAPLGSCFLRTGKLNDAKALLRSALVAGPAGGAVALADASIRWAVLLDRQTKSAEAVEVARQASAVAEAHLSQQVAGEVRVTLSALVANHEGPKAAEAALMPALKQLDADSRDRFWHATVTNLALYRASQGHLDGVEDLLSSAASQHPEDVEPGVLGRWDWASAVAWYTAGEHSRASELLASAASRLAEGGLFAESALAAIDRMELSLETGRMADLGAASGWVFAAARQAEDAGAQAVLWMVYEQAVARAVSAQTLAAARTSIRLRL